MVAGTYSIGPVGAGASRTIKLKVKVTSAASVGSARSILISSTSTGVGRPKDTVKATVKAG